MSETEPAVFLSYSNCDFAYVDEIRKRLNQRLERIGGQVWMSDEIRSGKWRQKIDEHLAAAMLLVVVVTEASMNSAYVTYEWVYSWTALKKSPYFLYLEEPDDGRRGMLGRIKDDLQLRPNTSLGKDVTSPTLSKCIEEIVQLAQEPLQLRAQRDLLTYQHNTEPVRAEAAERLGQASKEHHGLACTYLLEAVEGQYHGQPGSAGPIAKAIAGALAKVGDERAILPLVKLIPDVDNDATRACEGALSAIGSRQRR